MNTNNPMKDPKRMPATTHEMMGGKMPGKDSSAGSKSGSSGGKRGSK